MDVYNMKISHKTKYFSDRTNVFVFDDIIDVRFLYGS